jgi:superfamily II DNA or RNA helicase
MQLRDYQLAVKKEIYAHFRQGKRRCLVFAPTGSGKSLKIAAICKDALNRNKRVLILVHRTKLVEQLASTIASYTGHQPDRIIAGRVGDYNNPILISMAQTLSLRELPPSIDILIGDEIHEVGYTAIWQKCMDAYCGSIWALSKAWVIGFTATPWRTNNKQAFCHLFDCVSKAPSPRQLISMGFLTNPRIFAYNLLDTTKLEVDESGDYNISKLAKACDETYTRDVVDKWENTCKTAKTIAFCVSVAQAKAMNDILIEKGYKSEVITGSLAEAKRNEIFTRFKSGETQILVSIATLTTGFDETSIECVLIARPTRSPALLTQCIGRGLRIHPGKRECIIIDCGQCIDWISRTRLKGVSIEDPIDISVVPLCPKAKPVVKNLEKECLRCKKSIPIWVRICPFCECEIPKQEKLLPNIIDFPDLIEFFTSANKKQYEFIRKEMMLAFDRKRDPSDIFNKFHGKFGFLPPYDYFLGAIFNLEDRESIYRHFLTHVKLKPEAIEFLVKLEFGEIDRTYNTPQGSYKRKANPVSFDPHSFFASADIKQTYRDKTGNTTDSFALNYAYDFLLKLGD